MSKGPKKPGFPVQKKDLKLSISAVDAKVRGQEAPQLTHHSADNRTPEQMMDAMGFAPSKNMTPLQFLLAIVNDRTDLIYKSDSKRKRVDANGGISIQYRIEAAKTAARYIHQMMPQIQITKDAGSEFSKELAQALSAGQMRVRSRSVILETVSKSGQELLPDPASYPPVFAEIAKDDDASTRIIDVSEAFSHPEA